LEAVEVVDTENVGVSLVGHGVDSFPTPKAIGSASKMNV
ncbi:MAG: hypothetical protein ACI9QA_000667, partial [Methanobacteriota archaeon]